MKDTRRKRVLDDVDELKSKWQQFNPIFRACVPEFDEAFSRGIPLNLDRYITRQLANGSTYEDELCHNLLSTHNNPTGKAYVLKGDVGAGKTTFVRYVGEKVFPLLFPGSIVVQVDARTISDEEKDTTSEFERVFIMAVEIALTAIRDPLFGNQRAYHTSILEFLGYPQLGPEELFRMGRSLTLFDVVRYLGNLPTITNVVVVIDNIDESSVSVIEAGKAFALNIAGMLRANSKKSTCVLVTLRGYTVNQYFSTEKFAVKELYPIEEKLVLRERIKAAEVEIRSSAKEFTGVVTHRVYAEDGTTKAVTKPVTLTKESVCDFLVDLVDILFSTKEHEFIGLVRRLGAGNLKVVIGNTYNFIHSAKLDILPLFERWLAPQDIVDKTKYYNLVPFDLTIECLMAIHFPFYDVSASLITNIFNAEHSTAPNDFKNTLVIPRLLCYLQNGHSAKYVHVKDRFESIGYPKPYLNAAIVKTLKFGLVVSSHGYRIEHIGDESVLSLSSAGTEYIKRLILEVGYLQYACEDTPMSEEFRVPVTEKYSIEGAYGNRSKRLDSVSKFISFIEKEEMAEKKNIVIEKGFDLDNYLAEFSINVQDRGLWFHDHMKESTYTKLQHLKGE